MSSQSGDEQPGVLDEGQGGEEQSGAAGEDGQEQPLSRRQQKKLAKAQRIKEAHAARKAAAKERRAAEAERKREEAQARLAAMTEEERAAHEERRKLIREAAVEGRRQLKERTWAAVNAPLRVVIDLDFDGLMNPGEVKSLVSQVNFSYGTATKGDKQAHLHLLGARGAVKEQLRAQIPHLDSWALTVSDANFTEHFKGSLGDLVYLTADSPNELGAVDTSKVYVIGGIVDRNRHKRICLDRAEAAGVAHARLPIRKHCQLSTSPVITVNQVVELLVKGQGPDTDWPAVLASVLPVRKQAEGGGPSGDEGGGGGGGGQGGGGGGGAQEQEFGEGGGEGPSGASQEQQQKQQQQQQQQQEQQRREGEEQADGEQAQTEGQQHQEQHLGASGDGGAAEEGSEPDAKRQKV